MANKRINFNDGFTSEVAPSETAVTSSEYVRTTPAGNLESENLQDALEELQSDIDTKANDTDLDSHTADTANPHNVTKAQVGLGNVDNTADIDKPVSTATQTAIDTAVANIVNSAPETLDTLKELSDALGSDPNFATTTANSLGNRLRVDIDTQGLTSTQKTNAKTNIDLQNVDNTSDLDKPVSTATQAAINNQTSTTLNSSTLNSPTINSPSKLDAKMDTKANLLTYAATATNGQLVFATDEKRMFQVIDNELKPVGGGSDPVTFSILNNQLSYINLGLNFNGSLIRSFNIHLYVEIKATANKYETFTLMGTFDDSEWTMTSFSQGGDTGVDFEITATGDITYTSPNHSGFTSGNVKAVISQLAV
jgi:hypothetical protein